MNLKNTALVVIDIINSCADQKCEIPKYGITFSKIRKIVPKLEKFIDDYRKIVGGLVIFTNTVPWQKKYLVGNINELYADSKVRYYSKDNSGFPEKFYKISPKKGDVIITKNTIDTFTNKKLENVLKRNKVRYLVIIGVFGDGCVLATICGGFSKGYNFVILKDLIETTDVKVRQELLKLLKKYTWPIMYGPTIESEVFLKLFGHSISH